MSKEDYIFISYSHHDSEIADRLAFDLRRKNFEVWVDVENIGPGKDWQAELEIGLKNAKAVILLVSNSALSSTWVTHEVSSLLNRGKLVIPVVVDDFDTSALPGQLERLKRLDFRSGYESSLTKLTNALRKEFPHVSTTTTTTPPLEHYPDKKSQGYVFISYAEEDLGFVEELINFLKKSGFAYWDYATKVRDYHNQFFRELEGVIIEAKATLCILSSAWKDSRWTLREFFFSEEVDTPVFLLDAKQIPPTLPISGMLKIGFFQGYRGRL